MNNNDMTNYNDEITVKQLFVILIDYKNYLLSKYKKILIFVLFSLISSYILIFQKDDNYTATMTFVVEENSNSSFGGGSLGGLSSQLGFNLGQFMGASSTYSQENVLELIKSRSVIIASLMNTHVIDNKKTLLIDHYTLTNDFNPRLVIADEKNTFKIDSLSNIVWKHIINEDELIIEVSKFSNIISLSYTSVNQIFTKAFVDELINETINQYVKHNTNQAVSTLDFLQERADSVFNELEIAEEKYAAIKDVNARIIKASGRLNELQLFRKVEVLNTMYVEIVKNLELSKLTLLQNTPLIYIIDRPILPLQKVNKKALYITLIILLSFFLSIFYFILVKFIKDIIKN